MSATHFQNGKACDNQPQPQHFRSIPWILIYLIDGILAFACSYLILGNGNIVYWLFLLPAFAAIFAFPVLSLVLVAYSYLLQMNTVGCPEKYWTFKDKNFEAQWRGKKIPVLTLYEAYFADKIDLSEDENGKQRDLLQTLMYQRKEFARFVIEWEHIKFFLTQFIPELLTHSRAQDVTQVREHYDRGDDFYGAFLGPSMTYTSGIFQNMNDNLEEAQTNKMELVANKIHLKKGDQHLDLGCGWGTFINYCAKNYGTDSTGITLGKNQTDWANNLAEKGDQTDKARALCTDYRDVPQLTNNKKYDKITCLEMSEHVGVKNYSKFCDQVFDMLNNHGIFYLQIAGLRRPFMFEDLTWGLFMGKYIFPGADASCPLGWVVNHLEAAGFEVRSVETIGIHYSLTIKKWYDNWCKPEHKQFIIAKYGIRWYRLWMWFLAWSVISAGQGSATCYQIVCHKNFSNFDRTQFLAERSMWKI